MILCVIQARTGSSRLPNKVLKEICGKPVLFHIIKRLEMSSRITKIIVATSNLEQDNDINELCNKYNVFCFRGSEEDVLDRYYNAVKPFSRDNIDGIVRITADCPLIDFKIVDRVIEQYEKELADYATNTNPPTFPDGLDVEVFSFKALEQSWKEAKLPSEREHVTPYIKKNKNLFKQVNIIGNTDLSHLRWTLDEEEDLQLIIAIYNGLYYKNKYFLMEDVLELLNENPKLIAINEKIHRNEGYNKSLKLDNT